MGRLEDLGFGGWNVWGLVDFSLSLENLFGGSGVGGLEDLGFKGLGGLEGLRFLVGDWTL